MPDSAALKASEKELPKRRASSVTAFITPFTQPSAAEPEGVGWRFQGAARSWPSAWSLRSASTHTDQPALEEDDMAATYSFDVFSTLDDYGAAAPTGL